ncbi:MAG: hypothetical protein ABJL55_03195 [Roseibium sp.]
MALIQDPILRAWLSLLALSAASVLVAFLVPAGLNQAVIGSVILLLAWMKVRLILSRYLGLWQAPSWKSGFNWVLGFYCLLLLGLYLIPALAG